MSLLLESNELLEICKNKIAAKFANGAYGSWVNNDYIRLSEDILEYTKKYLSPTSLKRIFGKINSDAFPKRSTLDILALYIDYKDWQDFAKQYSKTSEEIKINPIDAAPSHQEKFRFKKPVVFIALFIAFSAGLGLIGYLLSSKKNEPVSFSFSQLKPVGKAPFTASFQVAIPNNNSDSISLDFSDPFETDLQFTSHQLTDTAQTISHTYMVPGVYHPHIIVNKKIIDSLDVPVYSDGWEWLVVNYHEKNRAFHTIQDKPSFRKNGIFCVPSTEVASYKVDTITSYCMRYLNYQNFNVTPDGIRLELKICDPVYSNIKCTNIEFQLKFMHWNVGFNLFHKGCNGNYSRVQMGSKVLNGVKNDLSMFEVNLNEWQTILLEIKGNVAHITVNGIEIFSSKIEGDPGLFQGISINSEESARLDYLYLTSFGKPLLKEDF